MIKALFYGTTEDEKTSLVTCECCANRFKRGCPFGCYTDDNDFCSYAVKRQEPKFYKLKRCPFCGKDAYMKVEHHTPSGWEYTPMCSDPSCAGRLTKKWLDGEQAAAKWNSRAERRKEDESDEHLYQNDSENG